MFKRLLSRLGPAKPNSGIIGLQNAVTKSVAGDVTDLQDGEWGDRDWVYLAVNHEILAEEGHRSSTQAKVLAQRPGSALEEHGFRLSMATKANLLALRDAMAAADGRTWTVVDLTMERDGHFTLVFGYDRPTRLSGDLLYSPLSGLLRRYLSQ